MKQQISKGYFLYFQQKSILSGIISYHNPNWRIKVESEKNNLTKAIFNSGFPLSLTYSEVSKILLNQDSKMYCITIFWLLKEISLCFYKLTFINWLPICTRTVCCGPCRLLVLKIGCIFVVLQTTERYKRHFLLTNDYH